MRIAVVGCGSMGKRRIRHLVKLRLSDIVTYDIRPDRIEEVKATYQVRTVSNVESLVKEEPVAIFICVPPASHMHYIDLALQNGWHMMTEQPVSHSLEKLDDVVRAVKNKKLSSHVSCNKRFHPAILRLQEFIQSGTIGKPLAGIVEIGEWLPDWHPYEPYTDYYPSRKSLGGGIDAVCDLDWLRYLFGEPRRIACLASKRSTLNIDTDDVVQILFDFTDGPQIVLHTDMIQRVFSNTIKLIGEKGTLTWARTEHCFNIYTVEKGEWEKIDETQPAGDDWEPIKPGWEWVESMYFEDTHVFIERIQERDPSTVTLESGIENLRIILDALSRSRQNY